MKKLLALALVALMAGGAIAQELPGMGVFFSNTEFTDATTNANPAGAFTAYVVLIGSPYASIGGYECGLTIPDAGVFILSVTGENNWTNFGSNLNHLCGFGAPVTVTDGAVVLCTMNMLYTGSSLVEISMGPSDPASIAGVPVIADGSDPDTLLGCNLTSGNTSPGLVATLNGGGVTATENSSWTGVKNLFN